MGVWVCACVCLRAISARYSCVRHQGFRDRVGPGGSDAHLAPENQIIDYSVQRYRVLKWTATAYAIRSATRWLVDRRHQVEATAKDGRGSTGVDALLDDLPELHATGAGLKALCCVLAADGIEDLRRSCGGHGYLMSSGIAPLEQDYKGPNTTAEGDYVLLSLQTARYLMKSLDAARRGEALAGLTAGLAALSDNNFSPLKNGRDSLGLPASAGTTGEMTDPVFLEKLFQWRSLVCITRVGTALDKARAGGLSETDAWNRNARLLYTTASCHVRYFLIQKFSAVADAASDVPSKLVLRRLVSLFGLSDILEGEQWLGLITAEEAALAEESVYALCEALRPDIIALTDAFDFPDRVLNSALGRADGNVYESLLEEARKSSLNVQPDGSRIHVPKFVEAIRPYIDVGILEYENRAVPAVTGSKL